MSYIKNFIEKDKSVFLCKKNAKCLFKKLKITHPHIKLMECQNTIAQEMGYKDWFDLYHKTKCKYQVIEDNRINDELFYELLNYCLINDAYDIHFECRKEKSFIRYRDYDEFKFYHKISSEKIQKLYYYIIDKYCSSKNYIDYIISHFSFQIMGVTLNISCTSLPAYPQGNDLILRIKSSNDNRSILPLYSLGFSEQQISTFNNIKKINNGALLVSGTCGAGKSTTIRSLIYNLYYQQSEKKQIVFLEEFPNCIIEDNNMNIVSESKDTLSQNTLNNTAAIVIDELRSKETGNLLVKYIDSNCTVFSRIHASHALGILLRLEDLSISYEKMAEKNFLNCLTYQKLCPVTCSHCSHNVINLFNEDNSFENKNNYLKFLKLLENEYPDINITNIKLRNHKGCVHCKEGIIGRTVCAEVIEIDDYMRNLIKKKQNKELQQYWNNLSDCDIESSDTTGKTISEHALYKVLNGIIDPLSFNNYFNIPINKKKLSLHSME